MLIQRWRADFWTLFKVFLRVEGRLCVFSISCFTLFLCLCVGTVDWVSWWIMSFPCWVKNKVQLSVSQSSVHSVFGVNLSLRSVRRTCFYRPSQRGHLLHVHGHLCHQKHLAVTLPHLCLKTNKVAVLSHLGNTNCTTAPQSWTSLRENTKTHPSVTLMGCR